MADAKTAILITLDDAHEGGYQANPNDHANWTSGIAGVGTLVGTKYGITCLDLPGVSIKDLTEDQAVEFYMSGYWKILYTQITMQVVANKLFDMGVLMGVGTAVKILEQRLQLPVDGVFGPDDLEKTNQLGVSALVTFKEGLHAHVAAIAAANPKEAGFAADWNRRIDS